MRFSGPLIVVSDMEKAKGFYYEVLGLEVIADFGANVILTGGISLQTKESWSSFIHRPESEMVFGGNVAELYFEEDDFDDFIQKLNAVADIHYVHSVAEHSWGQRGVRFFDPDQHIIEVGENMAMVVRRYINSGLSVEETATRMDVPVDYVRSCLDIKTVNVVAAIICQEDKIFATQRGSGEFKGGWEFPGGKIEPGESPEQALIREIQEELETEIRVDRYITTIDYDYPDFHLTMQCFLCSVVKGDLILSEHSDAKWLSRDNLDTVDWLPADIEVIQTLKSHWI